MGAPARARRIGLFGGSFDPPHAGHLHVARAARERFGLDRVVFVPAAEPPHKPGRRLVPGEQRLAMLRLLIEGEPRCEVSGLELERGGRSFTIDTVRELPARLSEPEGCEIYLLLGSDNLAGLAQWREAAELLRRVQPVVVRRAGALERELAPLRESLGDELANKLERGALYLPPVRASSTELRDALPGSDVDARLVPPAVLAYIRAQGLYGARRT